MTRTSFRHPHALGQLAHAHASSLRFAQLGQHPVVGDRELLGGLQLGGRKGAMDQRDALLAEIRRFWDDDAATYDRSPGHRPTDPTVRRAWEETFRELLPPPPAKVLDVGAGTGFLSLMAARAGHTVTALDLSSAMLEHLQRAAACEDLAVTTIEGLVESPPPGPFDVVVERSLLWTLLDPKETLSIWRTIAPRLVVIEGLWGTTSPMAKMRDAWRERLRHMRRIPPDHHGDYGPELRRSLPLDGGTSPSVVLDLVAGAGWRTSQLVWLDEVVSAERRALPLPERLLGVSRRFAVIARD